MGCGFLAVFNTKREMDLTRETPQTPGFALWFPFKSNPNRLPPNKWFLASLTMGAEQRSSDVYRLQATCQFVDAFTQLAQVDSGNLRSSVTVLVTIFLNDAWIMKGRIWG